MRYSSDRQTEQSIEGQERVCREFCERKGFTVVDKYIDRATSAFKDAEKRDNFQQMIRDSEKQLWDAVVVYKLDRFARNRYDSAIYKSRLKKNGIAVISATENISDNPEGVILEAVLEGMAEFYSKELAQKVNRGMRETALKCNSTGGKIPLGYKIENKKYVIDEPKAEIVREAFRLYTTGTSIKEICEIFNSRGYRTSQGALFNKASFQRIFNNEKYIGVYQYNGIRIEDGIPTIIDKETFRSAQMQLEANKQAPAKYKAKINYLLSGKLFCGHCNSIMHGESGTGRHGGTYYYYSCKARKSKKSCDKKALKKDFIENAVVEDVLSLIKPETIDEIATMAMNAIEADIKNNTLVPSLRAQITETEKAIANIVKMIEKGIASEALAGRLAELEEQKTSLQESLNDAEKEIIDISKEEITWWLSRFCNGDPKDETFKKNVIDLLVNSVTVWDEPDGTFRITTVYNLTSLKSKTIKCSDLRTNEPPNKKASERMLFCLYKAF